MAQETNAMYRYVSRVVKSRAVNNNISRGMRFHVLKPIAAWAVLTPDEYKRHKVRIGEFFDLHDRNLDGYLEYIREHNIDPNIYIHNQTPAMIVAAR